MRKAFLVTWAVFLLGGMHVFLQNQGGTGLELPVNAIAWMFASIVIGLGMWQVGTRGVAEISRFQQCAWIGALLMIVPLLYPGFPFKLFAVPRLSALFGGLVFLFALHQFELERRERFAVLYFLLGAVLIETVVGVVQFFLLPIGEDWLHNGRARVVYGIFQQVNVMGSFMASGLAVALYLAANEERLERIRAVLVYASLVAAPFIILESKSRVAVLGMVIAILCIAPALIGRSPRRFAACLACCALGVSLAISPPEFSHRAGEEAGPRTLMWPYSLQLILAKPWLGYGYGGFESAYMSHYLADRASGLSLPKPFEGLDHPHNELILWAFEGGIVPLAGMLIAVGSFLWIVLSRLPARAAWALLGVVAPFITHTQTEFPFYQSTACWLVFLFFVYVGECEAGDARLVRWPYAWPVRMAAIAAPLIAIPVMIVAMQAGYWVAQYERTSPRDLRLLDNVWSPWSIYRRYEMDLHQGRLVSALETHDRAALEEYVGWAREFGRQVPRWAFLHNSVLALEAAGNSNEAQIIKNQLQILYPEGTPSGTR